MNALSGDAAAQRANSASASASAVCSPLRTASAAPLAPSSNNATMSSPFVKLRPHSTINLKTPKTIGLAVPLHLQQFLASSPPYAKLG
jgi:hypothetical protein